MKTLVTIIGWALAVYAIYCAILFLAQRKLMFPRYLTHVSESETPGAGVIASRVDISGGYVETWFLPPRHLAAGNRAPAIIFAHGNAEVIDYLPEEFEWLCDLGVGVLLVEFPGYGRCPGKPSQASITEAFVSAYDLLVRRSDVDKNRIVLAGRSIGGGAVCALAEKRPSAAVILISSFTSARVFATAYFAPGFLMLDPFDNISVIKSYTNPVLIIHGEHDEIIPFSHGLELAEAAPKGKLIAYSCGHNNLPPDHQRFREDFLTFLVEAGIFSDPSIPMMSR
jgi:fermentation-respiration switch protein FrsA (DUF1100 family)